MSGPLFSVILPVYNAELYLKECVDSLFDQFFTDFELIIIDDGSTDSSLSIIYKYKEIYNNVIVIEQTHKNAGVARNNGLKIAKGKYLLFLDADDYVSSSFFSKLVQAINNKPDVVVFATNEFNCANKRTKFLDKSLVISNCPDHHPFSPREMNNYLFNSFQNWPWNKAYKRSFIIKNNIKFQDVNRSNDVLFVSLALSLSNSISVINEPLIVHRVGHCTNMQANNSEEPLAFWDAFSTTYNTLKKRLNDDFNLYERSYLNCVLIAFKMYVLSMSDDLVSYNAAKNKIINEGEMVFGFLKHDSNYYYDKNVFIWYINLLNKGELSVYKRNSVLVFFHKIVFAVPKKTFGLLKSVFENGIDYTFHRILFHLHLASDNDPQRTKNQKGN